MQKYIHWGYFMYIKSRENSFLKCLNFKNYSSLIIGGLNRKWTWKALVIWSQFIGINGVIDDQLGETYLHQKFGNHYKQPVYSRLP